MKDFGGFCHNAFSIKLLDRLEKRYASFDGLNLSWDVIEGIAKHNGPIHEKTKSKEAVFAYDAEVKLDLKKYPSAEAQVASISDDIAYNSHDIEDGLRSKMFSIEQLNEIEFFKKHIAEVRAKYKNIDDITLSYEISRIFTKTLVQDLIDASSNNFYNYGIKELKDINELGKNVISFSKEKAELLSVVKKFLNKNFYRHHKINLVAFKCKKIVTSLFNLYINNPECLPPEWQNQVQKDNKAQVVSDYIAGMTDRYALKEFEAFYSVTSIEI
jgi:dGTPase